MTVVNIHFMGVIMCSQLSLASQVVHPFLFLQKSLLCCWRLVGWWLLLMLDWKKIEPWIGNTHAHTREHALIFSGGPLFTSSITLATLAAGSFHCAMTCRRGKKKKEIVIFTAEIKETEREGLERGWGRQAKMIKKKILVNQCGFWGSSIVRPPPARLAVAEGEGGDVEGEKKLLVFLKAQKGWRRGESGG